MRFPTAPSDREPMVSQLDCDPLPTRGKETWASVRNICLAFVLSLVNGVVVWGAGHPVPESPYWLTYVGQPGLPGNGKHIVLIAAEQEYRSEHAMPMLARLLSKRHGFDCTVLFNLNANHEVDPTQKIRWEDKSVSHHIPGLECLSQADLVIFFTRLLSLPPEDLARIHTYLDSGNPIMGLRTANHGFLDFAYERKGRRIDFGDDVLGGSFRSHHGRWQQDSTRGILVDENREHPILRGVHDIWGTTDVYRTYPEGGALPEGCTPLVMGQPLTGRQPSDPINPDLVALPVAWTKTWTGNEEQTSRVFHLTMGSAEDYKNEGVRRLTVNAVYWCVEMEDQINPLSNVDIVGPYAPPKSGFDYQKLNIEPQLPSYYK